MKFRTTAKQIAAGIIAAAMLVGTLAGCSGNSTKQSSASSKAETSTASIKRGESHDPSIVKANGKYYIFGSHRAWLKSDDLINWSTFTNNLSTDYEKIFKDIWDGWAKQSSNPDVKGNMWAPDVIWNETMGKWCMYMSINGANYRSVIVLLTADDIEGDWTYVGPVVYSGFERVNVKKTDVPQVLGEDADITRYTSQTDTGINAIDPCVKTDDNGDMWMTFGSWFGGMWMFKLDSATGLRLQLHLPHRSEQVRRLLWREARRRLRQLRRRLLPAARQRLLVSIRLLRRAAADRWLPDPHVPLQGHHRPVR